MQRIVQLARPKLGNMFGGLRSNRARNAPDFLQDNNQWNHPIFTQPSSTPEKTSQNPR
jgi:hypothetical protein